MATKKIKLSELKNIVKELIKEETNPRSDINKFVYFSMNYPGNFIEQIWDSRIADHLKGKFDTAYKKYGSVGAMVGFYINLDNENQKMLEDYITNNYKG